MKTYLIFILLLAGFVEVKVNAANPKFFVVSQSKSDLVDAKSILQVFETDLFKDLMKTFPCIDYMDQGSLGEMLRWERMRQLLGSGGDEELKNIAGGIGSDYLVKFTVTMMGNQMYMNAFCMDTRKAITLARADASGTIGQAIENAKKVSKDMVKQLEEYEICPFYGPLTIEVKGDRDETTTDNGFAPCGGGSRTTTINTKMNSTLKWKLTKVSPKSAVGTANYNSTENIKIESNYSCYRCKSGTEGSAKITETQDSETKVEGLSNESVSEGNKVDDARIKLVFLENGSYYVLVEATSKNGVLKRTTETKVEGVCEDENKPKDTKNNKIDVPIKVIFGPYPGKPSDKVLQKKETKDVSQGQEKTTVKIDFTLTRKD